MSDKRLTLDDLPRFSPWPARLLGIAPWQTRQKSAREVIREYEGEKWGPLLRRVRDAGKPVALEDVEEWLFSPGSASLCSVGSEFRLMSGKEACDYHRDLAAEVLRSFAPASALVELGCGYGGVILSLARRPAFRGLRLLAGEYTPSGIELTQLLARAQSTSVTVGRCDFRQAGVADLEVPEGAVVFTSFATHYVPELEPGFVHAIAAWRPRAVVHFEPCYEHCDQMSLLGLMRRRYIEVNDYNRNLIALLRAQEDRGSIQMLQERAAVFGANPLLAASVVAWAPRAG